MTGRQEGRHQVQPIVRLRRESDDSSGHRFTAWIDDQPIALVVAAKEDGWLRVALSSAAVTLAMRLGLVRAVTARASAEGLSGVVLAADSNLLLRHAARAVGFAGPLRSDLIYDFRAPVPDEARSVTPHDGLLSDLEAWLPAGVTVLADRRAGWLRSFVRSASSGVPGTVHLSVFSAAGAEPLRLAVPIGDGLLAEGVALTIDTALAIRRRFAPLVDQVRIFYDQSIESIRTGKAVGAAAASVRDIHLSPSYASAGETDAQQHGHRGGGSLRKILSPFTAVDFVVAHEYWHQIEFGFESGRYRDSVEFRRAVGGYFGVETLEQAIKGGTAKAPAQWQAAHTRLATEVSAYATTAPKEATAELFSQWWCTPGAPPPSAQAFEDLLRRFFPLADLER